MGPKNDEHPKNEPLRQLCPDCLDNHPQPLHPSNRRAAVKLDTKRLDAIVGDYTVAPNAATQLPHELKVRIWREGDQLLTQAWIQNIPQGMIAIYPESENQFFVKFDGAQLIFIKNDQGQVTANRHHVEGQPDLEGNKLPTLAH